MLILENAHSRDTSEPKARSHSLDGESEAYPLSGAIAGAFVAGKTN